MKRNVILIILALVSRWFAAEAQTDEYRFSRISVNQGLSNNQIKTIFKDQRGFLWIGTISGLNRYDGYNFRTFTSNPGDSTSLISSDINRIFEGPGGKLWIHTWSGTNVYDPLTETFDRNADRILATLSIPGGVINDIKQDAVGNFWFLHSAEGLFRYSPADRQTVNVGFGENDSTLTATKRIAAWNQDPAGNIWILHTNGILEKINPATLKVEYRNRALQKHFRNQALEYQFMTDRDGDLWFYINNHNTGVFRFRPSDEEWSHFDQTSEPRLNSSIVRGIVEDQSGVLWIATDHGGINLLNKRDMSASYILSNPEDEKSLSQNSINVLYKDKDDIIWAGTFKNGVSYYHPNINRFKLYRNQVSNPNSLPFNDINTLVEDQHRNIWIGTNGGGLIYFDRRKNSYTQYLHDPGNANSLNTNVIVSLCLDRRGKLWIGTYFGGLQSFDGQRFVTYKYRPDDPGSISDNSIWEIFEDSRGNLWIGTLTQGANMFDRTANKFVRYNVGGDNSIHASYVPAFMEDREGNLWIGTGYGIDMLDHSSGKFTHFLNRTGDPTTISNNSVLAMYEDSRGLIWIGTHGGLNLFDRRTKTFSAFTKADGLPHNSILTILEDNNHDLWVSTPHGISNVKIRRSQLPDSLTLTFKNYDEKDGLQGIQFNENAACKTADGELVFAGANGFNIFKPETIGANARVPNVILTDFQIFNRSVGIGEERNGNVILKESISETESVVLEYNDNVFSLEFATLSQFHPEKSQYQYMLQGFNEDWTTTEASQRKVTYTNLDPGAYIFKVKAANNDGVWNEQPTELHIKVLPPFWKSPAAFVIYALATLAALLVARWLILYNE
ncbi:MAG: hybrid sensor histidine kinase/response regulator, partial [Bacteroidota bacterium]|nr:hybrid sensor histidine kinase/response regulator [Bacteroidota bacterium]